MIKWALIQAFFYICKSVWLEDDIVFLYMKEGRKEGGRIGNGDVKLYVFKMMKKIRKISKIIKK